MGLSKSGEGIKLGGWYTGWVCCYSEGHGQPGEMGPQESNEA